MIPSRRLAAAALMLMLAAGLVVSAFTWGKSGGEETATDGEQPELLLLTSLPLMFGDGFEIESAGSPALSRLQEKYQVIPVSTSDAQSLAGKKLLLMAQPHAQTAQALVDLDRWVRRGGHVLLLADPVLEWPSELPLGDLGRPAFSFSDSGLLGHWGLRLDSLERPGPATFEVDGKPVHALSPGVLVATDKTCAVEAGGTVGRCSIGKGRATVIADADFIDVDRRRGSARSGNLDALLTELERLER